MFSQQNGRVCGRGVLALKTWKPLRKPGQKIATNNKNSTSVQVPKPPRAEDGSNPLLLVKYTYRSKADQPGGFPELTVKQGQKVRFLNIHPDQPLWWNVEDENKDTGYVPGSYVMVLEDKPSNLPWLENKKLEEQAKSETRKAGPFGNAPAAVWKPYVSAYGNGAVGGVRENQKKQYYCDICDKQLNGPKPYQAHMVSKAHKDELEAQGLS